MPRKAQPKPDAYDLTKPQLRALAALLEGASVTEAASQAGVSRQTVSGWKNQNAVFVAAMNAATRDRVSHAQALLLDLVPRAITVLAADLEHGGEPASRAARVVLRSLERLSLGKVGSADPVLVQEQMADERFGAFLLGLSMPLSDNEPAIGELAYGVGPRTLIPGSDREPTEAREAKNQHQIDQAGVS